MPQVEMILFLLTIIVMCVDGQDPASKVMTDRYAVFWNRSNPRWDQRRIGGRALSIISQTVCVSDAMETDTPRHQRPSLGGTKELTAGERGIPGFRECTVTPGPFPDSLPLGSAWIKNRHKKRQPRPNIDWVSGPQPSPSAATEPLKGRHCFRS
ncbi:hypothetical protein JOQ06_008164, partial [Pogonophryne albipinna]